MNIIHVFATFLVFIAIDFLWLGVIARSFYQNQLGSMLRPDIEWVSAVLFYVLYSVAIVFFAVNPSMNQSSLIKPLLIGAFFGIVAYATYDLTNFATLKDWPLAVVLADIAWGAVLTGLVAMISYWMAKTWF